MEIREVKGRRDLEEFIQFPEFIYAGDPRFALRLRRELREQFSSKNPFFRHAEARYFLARNNGRTIGRVAGILNQRHVDFHRETAGFFGFFESVNDPAVSCALLDAASVFLRDRGMTIMRGPMNFSTNEECGFLIEGFEEAPMLMTPYNLPYYNGLMEEYGMQKAKDLNAFIYSVRERLPEKVLRVAAIAEKRGIKVRQVRKERFSEEMEVFREVYNAAWQRNWGFIPLTDEEIRFLGDQLRQIVVPELTLIAEDNDTPVGFMGLLPDFNVVLRKMHGRLTPVSLVKALYYSRRITDLRLLLLGIKKDYRNRGVDALLFREGFEGVHKGGYKRVEFSWVLEDNIPVNRIVEMVGGRLYKRYRIYEKAI